jgi:hypothetical protein
MSHTARVPKSNTLRLWPVPASLNIGNGPTGPTQEAPLVEVADGDSIVVRIDGLESGLSDVDSVDRILGYTGRGHVTSQGYCDTTADEQPFAQPDRTCQAYHR